MKQSFTSLEYTSEDSFMETEYSYDGSEETGWKIFRNGKEHLELGKGYKLLQTILCGVCSTDLDRRFLPFPLPQITGHELIAMDPTTKKKYAVEINDTLEARGETPLDSFCSSGIPTHSPTRQVLGIDRLPGGFGKFILAPKNAMIDIESIPEDTAVMMEPFAAALQAVIASPPKEGSEVAVLGPRRLGSLLLAALVGYRQSSGKKFKITSLARHDHLLNLSKQLGADEAIDLRKLELSSLYKRFSIVYDTTSKPEGFELALKLAKDEVHIKSTNGLEVSGIKKMTELVVDELSIIPFSEESMKFHWENSNYQNDKIYISPSIHDSKLPFSGYKLSFQEAISIIHSKEFENRLPRFDLAIAGNLAEIDSCIRPMSNSEDSLVRPRGAILFRGDSNGNSLLEFLNSGGKIRSSRCGDFHLALKILKENSELAKKLPQLMITHEFSANELEKAFSIARDSNSVKVIVRH
ncbi:MAG: threonine dehydrogenase [Leptospiraceae bacterium]|nr:threonine dehydrogenase [Leptospiraceae bacterium]